MKTKYISYIILILLLTSCGKKISGISEEAFTSSRLEVEENLTALEKENLEKALRVVVLHASSEKWHHPKKYTDQSIRDITLDVVDNKSYKNLVQFAEDFLAKENTAKITALEKEIAELKSEREKTGSMIAKLDTFKTVAIEIIEGSWNTPTMRAKIMNTGALTKITEYMFQIEIHSIAQNKKIDGIEVGGSFNEGWEKNEDNFFTYVSRSLGSIMERSKRLTTQLAAPKYPITDIEKYDLHLQVKAKKITLQNGEAYTRPKKDLTDYDNEINTLQEQLAQIKSLKATLDEYDLQDADSTKTVAFNEEYMSVLSKIRQAPNKANERLHKVHEDLILTFPSTYEIRKEKHPGMYSLTLNDHLSFDTMDKNLIQYQIRDTTYVEYEDLNKKAKGILNVLKKENVSYDIQETIHSLKTTKYYQLIDADETGYIYLANSDVYSLFRYFRIEDTHYSYTMDFNDIEDCIQEFDRSKGIIK